MPKKIAFKVDFKSPVGHKYSVPSTRPENLATRGDHGRPTGGGLRKRIFYQQTLVTDWCQPPPRLTCFLRPQVSVRFFLLVHLRRNELR
jgi:hypothetical protein